MISIISFPSFPFLWQILYKARQITSSRYLLHHRYSSVHPEWLRPCPQTYHCQKSKITHDFILSVMRISSVALEHELWTLQDFLHSREGEEKREMGVSANSYWNASVAIFGFWDWFRIIRRVASCTACVHARYRRWWFWEVRRCTTFNLSLPRHQFYLFNDFQKDSPKKNPLKTQQ